MNYQAIYNRNLDAERKSLSVISKQLQADYEAALLAEKKKRQPRARVNFKPLPEDVAQEILARFKASAMYQEFIRLDQEIDREKENRETLLNAAAKDVVFEPVECMHRLRVSYSASYSSQGYGDCTYAKGALEPYADHLRGLGFEVYIRETNYRPAEGQWGCASADYELWANCEPWMFDAACRTLTVGAAVDSMKARLLNPLVYDPILPDCWSPVGCSR